MGVNLPALKAGRLSSTLEKHNVDIWEEFEPKLCAPTENYPFPTTVKTLLKDLKDSHSN